MWDLWGGPARRRGGSKLAVAAPRVLSPRDLTVPSEVVPPWTDGSPIAITKVVFRAFLKSSSSPSTPVPRERVHSSVLLHWSRFYTLPDAARSREGLPAPCQTHHRVASTPAAAEGIGAAARVHLVWSVSMLAATGGAAAAAPPRAPLGAPRSVRSRLRQ